MTTLKRNTGPNALRRGRVSIPTANYFVTICVAPRRPILTGEICDHLLETAYEFTRDQTWSLRCMTIMPDHTHLLFTLGKSITLAQAVARFKFQTRSGLSRRGATWQPNFYDHRLRPDDSVEAVLRYIWMNPYVAALIADHEKWPHFYCQPDDWAWFQPLTNCGMPFPDWLQ